MSDNQVEDIVLDGSDLEGYQPPEGSGDGPAGVYKMDGNYRGTLSENFKFGVSEREVNGKTEKNTWINIGICTIDDAPGSPESGKMVYGLYNLEGKQDDNGPTPGRPNKATLYDMCLFAGRADLAKELTGKFSVKSILTRLTQGGKTEVTFRSSTRTDKKGVRRTEPRYFIKPERYTQSLQSGKNFRVTPRDGGAPGKVKPNGVTAGGQTGSTQEHDALDEAI